MVIKNCWHNRPVFSRVIGALQEHDGSDPLTALTFATEVSGPRRGRRAEVGRPPRRGPDFLALAALRKGRGTLLVVCSAAGVTLPGVPPPTPECQADLRGQHRPVSRLLGLRQVFQIRLCPGPLTGSAYFSHLTPKSVEHLDTPERNFKNDKAISSLNNGGNHVRVLAREEVRVCSPTDPILCRNSVFYSLLASYVTTFSCKCEF